jgi:hypothetical protein
LCRARATGAVTSATSGTWATCVAGESEAGSAAAAGDWKEVRCAAGSTATGVSVIGAAVGSTENAGDLADRDDRRLDFFGAATSATRVT